MKNVLLWLMLVTLGFSSNAKTWNVDKKESSIQFKGKYLKDEFNGSFPNWETQIQFDPNNLSTSSIKSQIELSSTQTNDQSYTKTLSESDWFNSKQLPHATFTSREIRSKGQNVYHVIGDLEIKGITKTVAFDSKILISGDTAEVFSEIIMDRLNWHVGKASDPSGSWVDKQVIVTLQLKAHKI